MGAGGKEGTVIVSVLVVSSSCVCFFLTPSGVATASLSDVFVCEFMHSLACVATRCVRACVNTLHCKSVHIFQGRRCSVR